MSELSGQPSVSSCALAKSLVGEGWEEPAPPGPGTAEQRSEAPITWAPGQALHLLGVLPSAPCGVLSVVAWPYLLAILSLWPGCPLHQDMGGRHSLGGIGKDFLVGEEAKGEGAKVDWGLVSIMDWGASVTPCGLGIELVLPPF